MRNAVAIACFMLFFSSAAFSQMVEIQSMNGYEICQGYDYENNAYMQVSSNLPFAPPPNTIVVYTWTAEHPNGNKIWNTSLPYRTIPIPWVGKYTVRLKIEYIRRGKYRPFAAFFSNRVVIRGVNCLP